LYKRSNSTKVTDLQLPSNPTAIIHTSGSWLLSDNN